MVESSKRLFVRLLCEFLASFFVQVFGCVVSQLSGSIKHALAWGCAVIAATQAFRIVSGAHINPCISIAAMILNVVDIAEGFLYITFQFLGSALGFVIAYVGLHNSPHRGSLFCVAKVTLEPWWKSLLLEIYMTAAWVFAMCASWSYFNVNLLESISLRIGLVVAVCHIVGAAQTGCSMNPFRALWPAIAANHWHYAFIPLAVPLATSILLAVLWRLLYIKKIETPLDEL